MSDPILTPTWVIEEFDGAAWVEICLFVGQFMTGFKIISREHAGKNVRFKPVDYPYPIGYASFIPNKETGK